MTGGSLISSNKIRRGYDAERCRTGVDLAGERRLADFGLATRRAAAAPTGPIAQGGELEPADAGMAENWRSLETGMEVVAWLPSHGGSNGARSQAVGRQRRLIAGLTAGEVAQRSSARRRRGASPFRSAAVATGVASVSRGSTQIQARTGPHLCLKLRSARSLPNRPIGSGPGVVRSTPQNGVGGAGAGALVTGAKNRSASRENGAEGRNFDGLEHVGANAFRGAKRRSCSAAAAAVNASVQTSVDKSL